MAFVSHPRHHIRPSGPGSCSATERKRQGGRGRYETVTATSKARLQVESAVWVCRVPILTINSMGCMVNCRRAPFLPAELARSSKPQEHPTLCARHDGSAAMARVAMAIACSWVLLAAEAQRQAQLDSRTSVCARTSGGSLRFMATRSFDCDKDDEDRIVEKVFRAPDPSASPGASPTPSASVSASPAPSTSPEPVEVCECADAQAVKEKFGTDFEAAVTSGEARCTKKACYKHFKPYFVASADPTSDCIDRCTDETGREVKELCLTIVEACKPSPSPTPSPTPTVSATAPSNQHNDQKEEEELELDTSPEPSPSPTASPSSEPSQSTSPTASPSSEPSQSTSPTASPSSEPSPEPSQSPSPSSAAKPRGKPRGCNCATADTLMRSYGKKWFAKVEAREARCSVASCVEFMEQYYVASANRDDPNCISFCGSGSLPTAMEGRCGRDVSKCPKPTKRRK